MAWTKTRSIRILKFLGGVFLFLTLIGLYLFKTYDLPIPEGRSGPEADALARKMLRALNDSLYRETRFLEWSYRKGSHVYVWDKSVGRADVIWGDYRVDLVLDKPGEGTVYQDGQVLSGRKAEKILTKARTKFNNDSYWLVAPFKVFDPGTKRSVVTLENGEQALLVEFTSGGDTPGDYYLWRLNPNGFPNSFRMWVDILPIGGVEATWDDWIVTESGAFLPKTHQVGPITLELGGVRAYNEP